MKTLLERYFALAERPGDSHDLRSQKRIYLPMVSTGVLVSGAIAIVEYRLLDSLAFVFPLLLMLVFFLALAVILTTGNLFWSHYISFIGLLLCPPLNQWSLGGLQAAGAMMLWGISAPFGAILFQGIRVALPQFALYVLVCAVVLLMEFHFPAPWDKLDPVYSLYLLLANFSGFIMFIYVNVAHYARSREEAMGSLDREHRLLRKEQERSENLLLNVLPAPIAQRLKRDEKYIADAYPQVSILFADIVDFTPLSARLAPEELVRVLNEIFSYFDALAEKYGLEKIKTIGDAYMAAAGLPEPRADHAEACARMALGMQSLANEFQYGAVSGLQLRIGINTGPVVAGVIGSRKFIYDLWGDAVNTASRMESQGQIGSIQITEATLSHLGAGFVCEERGYIEIKGKGRMRTYFLRDEAGPEAATTGSHGQ